MGEQIIARKIQNMTKHSYIPGTCRCGPCNAGTPQPECNESGGIKDWVPYWTKCCGGFCQNQRVCVPPDRDECFIGNSTHGDDPLISVEWDHDAPNLKCIYNPNLIDSDSQVDNYIRQFGHADDVIGPYCEQQVPNKYCPDGMKTCSRFKSTGEGGNRCRDWYAKLPSDNIRDAVAQNYCFRSNTEDCRCMNRSTDDDYLHLKPGNVINDKCWYVPCANPSRYFIPSDLTKGSCPENVCEIIFNIYKDRDVKIYDNDITCNMNPGPDLNPIVQFLIDYWLYISVVTVVVVLGNYLL